MRRRNAHEKVERLRLGQPILDDHRRKIARWVHDHESELRDADPDLPDNLNDRAADNWRPLLAIADSVGGEWPERARQAVVKLEEERDSDDKQSTRILLLSDLRRLFEDREVLSSKQIVTELGEMEERPWPEYSRGNPISARKVAQLLSPFKIKPKQVWIHGNNERGYLKEDFTETFERYLEPEEATASVRSDRTTAGQQLTEDAEVLGSFSSNTSGSDANDWETTILTDLTLKTPGQQQHEADTPPGHGRSKT